MATSLTAPAVTRSWRVTSPVMWAWRRVRRSRTLSLPIISFFMFWYGVVWLFAPDDQFKSPAFIVVFRFFGHRWWGAAFALTAALAFVTLTNLWAAALVGVLASYELALICAWATHHTSSPTVALPFAIITLCLLSAITRVGTKTSADGPSVSFIPTATSLFHGHFDRQITKTPLPAHHDQAAREAPDSKPGG